jgi:glycosyltransferase involved in cell wall biosynthesis
MLSGLAVATASSTDAAAFVDHGRNAFCSDDAEARVAQCLEWLRHPERAREIGAAARRTALDLFAADRAAAAWSRVIAGVS